MSEIQLYKGDCLEIMKSIPDKSIDMILCDLPYGKTKCKWDKIIPFSQLWELYERIIKPNRAIILFGSEPFSSKLRLSNLKWYKYDWVWDKVKPSGHLNAKIMPMQQQENIMVFGNGKLQYYPIMIPQKHRISKNYIQTKSDIYGKEVTVERVTTAKYPKSIISFSNASQKGKLHPNQKPIALLEYLIKTYTNEGETVLDNCMGSGSTGMACKNTNRNFIGIEIDETYFSTAKSIIEELKYDL